MHVRYLVRCVAFLLPVASLLLAFEVRLRRMPNDYSGQRQDFERRLGDWEIVVTGSSNANYAINPRFLSGVGYDIAHRSQTFYYDAELIRRYADRMPKLKLVIVTVSYLMLEARLSEGPEDWRQFFYQRFWEIAPEGALTVDDPRHVSLFFLYTPLKSLGFALRGFRSVSDLDELGFHRAVGTDGTLGREGGLERARGHESLMRSENVPYNRTILQETIERLHRLGVKVEIVLLPAFPTYTDNVDPERRQRLVETMKGLSAQTGAGFHDYFRDDRFTDADFYNNDHMNEQGASRFSAILDEEVVRPALGPRAP